MVRRLLFFAAGSRFAGVTALSGRKLCEDFAPRDGATRVRRERGAKSESRRAVERAKSAGGNVKILLPETKAQGFAGSGEQRAKAAGRPRGRKALAGM